MFSNPSSITPRFVLSVTDQSLLNRVQSERLALETLLKQESARGENLSESSDLKAEITAAISETRQIKSFIDDLSALLNVSISSQTYSETAISGFIATASGARTAVSGTLAALTGAQQGLISTQTTGDTPDQASSANATLKQAQAAVDAAQANLNNTIIRAPISGTLNNLSIKLGDFVSAFQQVAVISNNGALEIIAHITPEDRATISSGSKVKIENEYDGWITSIAPAIDPTTKKIEVKIAFTGETLTNGESVHLDVARAAKKTAAKGVVALPIASIKIEPNGSVVFTVDENHKLVAHKVTTGQIIGDKIQIVSGVSRDMKLVVDARGLKDGQEVELQ
jgi:RND family efflux transporter MFP subunit